MSVEARLSAAGFIAAREEARELLAAAGGDLWLLEKMLQRRLSGEPLAWICGRTTFCGIELFIDTGVYVPRSHTEVIAQRAAELLGETGIAIDLCTGSGAVARVLRETRPRATVIATDLDARAVACAHRNGVDARLGDLFRPLPSDIRDRVDLIVAVVPYVPTSKLALLQRDTFRFENTLAYDGGTEGADTLRRVIAESPAWLRPGGVLMLEMGTDQQGSVARDLRAAGFHDLQSIIDQDGDPRGICAIR